MSLILCRNNPFQHNNFNLNHTCSKWQELQGIELTFIGHVLCAWNGLCYLLEFLQQSYEGWILSI